VGCGAWSLPLLAATLLLQQRHAAAMAFGFYALGVFCNNPHYMATVYRAYRLPSDFAKYRFFTVYVTLLLVLTVVIAHLVPGVFPWIVTLYLSWSPWHYTGQNFGIAQMFYRRAGGAPDPTARHLLYFSYAASYAGWLLALHARREQGDAYFLSLNIPPSVAGPLQILAAATFASCALAAFWRMARSVGARPLLAPAVLTGTQLLWFVLPALMGRFGGLELPASYFSAGILAFMHCAQYLWITTYYARRESAEGSGFSFARYYGVLVVGGLALFVPGPWIASRILGHDFVESFMIFMALVNLHHFILDGAIWKLRDGRIARLLLGSVPSRADPGPAAEPGARSHLGWLFGPTAAARTLRYGLAAGILALGAIDQWQDYLTQRSSRPEALARAEALNPSDPRVAFRRAQILQSRGDLPGAERELRGITARNPRNAPAERMLGEVLLQSGRAREALDQFDRMASLFPADAVVATNRGVLLRALGEPAQAAERFRQAMDLSPERNDLHFLVAEALDADGRPDEAAREYEAFTAGVERTGNEPEGGMARYLKAAIRLGDLYARAGEAPRAERWLQRAADVAATQHDFPDAAEALSRLAAVQGSAGEAAAAARTRTLAQRASSLASPRP